MFRGLERPPWWATVLLAVLTVGCIVPGIVAVTRIHASDPLSGERLARMEAGASAAASEAEAARQPPPFTLPAAAARVLVFGDSYTQGVGADDPNGGYAQLTADAFGWTADVEGVQGTGFINAGPNREGTFPQRAGTLIAAGIDPAPVLIIIQGGQNDLQATQSSIRSGVLDTIRAFRAAFPDAQLLLIGPMLPLDGQAAVTQTMAVAAGNELVRFLDPVAEGWLTGDGLSDGVHPTPEGHKVIAQRLADDLRSLAG